MMTKASITPPAISSRALTNAPTTATTIVDAWVEVGTDDGAVAEVVEVGVEGSYVGSGSVKLM